MIRSRYKKSHKRALLIAILIGGVVCLLLLSYFVLVLNKKPASKTARVSVEKTSQLPKKPSFGLPTRLKIPKIEVDAGVEYMGLTPSGDMDVPSSIVDVGWYKFGTRPGEKGSAVIDGHLDGVKAELGVFFNLNKLQKGDSLSVADDRGGTISFVVRETRTYGQNEHPSEVFTASDGAHLNLITCTGAWDTAQNRFSKRLVVFADAIN